ncbi:hypothetical protein PAXINDRAFT_171938 [Paxillus involutus ATCC 200175]|uniref:Uncharacterized protein n=1 Tax=Paxillus involutus ATCC 200175 TaxID=664439 RepID=A0A0C9T5T7_PAXIN|nr:hypothetical protein PAXINDRAFT_171938 [Paxillus involutus ATCC 200175]
MSSRWWKANDDQVVVAYLRLTGHTHKTTMAPGRPPASHRERCIRVTSIPCMIACKSANKRPYGSWRIFTVEITATEDPRLQQK